MKKSPLKDIMVELLKEAPIKPSATDIFQKVPFGQQYEGGSRFSAASMQQLIIEYIEKNKVPTPYAEILLRLPKVVDMFDLDSIIADAWESFQNIMGGENFDAFEYGFEAASRKILFPKDWKQMEKITSHTELKNFKFTGGVKYSALMKYIKNLFLFIEEVLTDDDTVTFPEYTSNYKLPYERNTPAESELAKALAKWFGSSNNDSANTFKKYYPAIQQAKSKFPKVFSPGKSKTPAYRGTTVSNGVVSILKKSSAKDWMPITDDGETFMVYSKPITYKPKRIAQSWTTNPSIARGFDSSYILITGISDQFFLNRDSSDALAGYEYNEDEIIHVGDKFVYPVFIAVQLETWDDLNLLGGDGGFQKVAGELVGGKVSPKKATPVKKKVAKKPVKKAKTK